MLKISHLCYSDTKVRTHQEIQGILCVSVPEIRKVLVVISEDRIVFSLNKVIVNNNFINIYKNSGNRC